MGAFFVCFYKIATKSPPFLPIADFHFFSPLPVSGRGRALGRPYKNKGILGLTDGKGGIKLATPVVDRLVRVSEVRQDFTPNLSWATAWMKTVLESFGIL